MAETLSELLVQRFGPGIEVPPELARLEALAGIAAHRSLRRFSAEPVPARWLETLLACALSAPSKSDLQQVSIIRVEDARLRAEVAGLLPSMPWVADAPVLLVFCGDGRRIRRICEARGRAFANDHLDAMFNPAVDAALAMMNFIRAAETAGLGCCPLSHLRNRAADLSRMLALPPLVFPVAGLVAGFAAREAPLSPRLPLSVTVHTDRYDDAHLDEALAAYDRRRAAVQPIAREKQRAPDRFGHVDDYGWSEDKARQVSEREREDFGRYLRAQGFRLD
ncbi:MAG: nitroreductase family protein [Gammaproteobacteria bacterium]|nr:nitroreductase family protein [Gammaproteobacteria bacterium]